MDSTGQGKVYQVVRLHDPAVNWGDKDSAADRERARKYVDERDVSELKFHDGKSPILFSFHRISRREMRDVESRPSLAQKHELAFAFGVSQVTFPNGQTLSPRGSVWTDDELDKFDHIDIEDVGSCVYQRSLVPLDCALVYVPAASSVAAWVRNWHCQSAAQSQVTARESNEKQEAV